MDDIIRHPHCSPDVVARVALAVVSGDRTVTEIGLRTGASRTSVYAALKSLAEAGVVDLGGSRKGVLVPLVEVTAHTPNWALALNDAHAAIERGAEMLRAAHNDRGE